MKQYTPQEIDQIIRDISNKYAPGDEEFYRVMSAIALAESNGKPNAELVNKIESSYGLYQNNTKGGRGTGYSPEQLKDPTFSANLAAKELIQYYNKAKALGLKGRRLTEYVSKYGQRPAAGNETKAGDRYDQFVGGKKGEKRLLDTIIPHTKTALATENKPTPLPSILPDKSNLINYTVKKGDTLWDLAQRFLGSGFRWRDIQGFAGNPTKLPIGTNLQIPTATVTPKPKEPTPVPVPTPSVNQNNQKENVFNPQVQPQTFQNASFSPYYSSLTKNNQPNYSPPPTMPITPSRPSFQTSVPSTNSSYTVRPGETLYGIAQKTLGSGARWQELQGYTGDPRKLQIGTVLKIPTPGAAR